MKTKTGEMGAQSKECQGLLAATRSSERGLILQWILPPPVQHPERAAIFSKYHISAALAGVEESPLAVTVIPLFGELM